MSQEFEDELWARAKREIEAEQKEIESRIPILVGEVYCHVNNGGITISLYNADGPTLQVITSNHGNCITTVKAEITHKKLLELHAMLSKAIESNWHDDSTLAAE